MTANRWLMTGVVLLSSCTALVFAGCFAPVEEGEAPVSEGVEGEAPAGDGADDVGVSQEALTACQSWYSHGGVPLERQYTTALGCACGAGTVRDRYTVWNDGNGDCSAVGWLSSDPHDCRVLVRIKDSGGFFYGNCNYLVESKPDPASCKDHCGGQAPSGCFCDAACTRFEDCCYDYGPVCT